MAKSTNLDLVSELERRKSLLSLKSDRYDTLIKRAKLMWYHDYKNPEESPIPKIQLVNDLEAFPELKDIRKAVIDGEYDEPADETDLEELRKVTPPEMWKMLGL